MKSQTITIKAGELVEAHQVGGDLTVEGWDREELEASGDPLRVERRPGAVTVSSAGDLTVRMPKKAHLSVSGIGGGVQLEGLAGSIELGLIGGDARLRDLSGPVRFDGLIGGEAHLENVGNISLTSGKLGDRFNMAERVRRKVEQAARHAESRIRRAEFRAFQQSRTNSPDRVRWGDASSAGQPAEAVSDEERMTILRMLQDKKITSEQAEQLLSALEGKA